MHMQQRGGSDMGSLHELHGKDEHTVQPTQEAS